MPRLTPGADGTRRWPVISALGVIMIFTWGTSYYLMAVLARPIAAETGWSLTAVTGALSLGLLVAGLVSPVIGRQIATHGGRRVLAAGCAVLAAGLGLVAVAPVLWVFWLGWALIGLGMAAGLYDPAFSTLGRLYGQEARGAITALTLWGGFASTVCWPLSAALLEAWGWRGVAGAYAALHLCVTLPLALLAIPRAAPLPPPDPATPPDAPLTGPERRVLAILAAMLVVHGLVVVNLTTWLFTFLGAQGVALAAAVGLGALMGPAQVGARVVEMAGRGRHHPIWTLTASAGSVATGLVLLALDAGIAGAAILCFGAGNGLWSIARGALPLAVFGPRRYPALMGRLARPALLSQAAAPLLGAVVIQSQGAPATLTGLAALGLLNLVLLALLWRAIPRVRPLAKPASLP